MFKRTAVFGIALCVMAALFAGCGNTASSSSSAASSSVAPSSATSDSLPAQSDTPSASQAASTAGAYDVNALLPALVEAANLGDTIAVRQLDMTASGHVSADNIVAMAGAESKASSENGGIVVVFEAAPGAAEALAEELAQFRDSRLDDRYAEFATALANTKEARIVTHGDYVVYAVSATGNAGGYDQLDAAIAAAFAA